MKVKAQSYHGIGESRARPTGGECYRGVAGINPEKTPEGRVSNLCFLIARLIVVCICRGVCIYIYITKRDDLRKGLSSLSLYSWPPRKTVCFGSKVNSRCVDHRNPGTRGQGRCSEESGCPVHAPMFQLLTGEGSCLVRAILPLLPHRFLS